MSELPVDTSNPAIRDYLTLTRLQVLSPLSLLINIAAVSICSFIISPGLGEIAEMYPTPLTPSPSLVMIYMAAVYIMQVGYCVLLVIARKSETKQALIKGTGMSLVLSNWMMGFWAITWSFKSFILSTILLGILSILLLYSNIVLNVYHPIAGARPLDAAFIHAPIRLFLTLPLTLLFPVSLFISLGYYWRPGDTNAYNSYAWEGFAVVFIINVLEAVFIVIGRDIVWAAAATWTALSIWRETPKSAPVSITTIAFTFLHPVVLIISIITAVFRKRRRGGAISLPPDEEAASAGNSGQGSQPGPNNTINSSGDGARRVWGSG